MRFCLYVLFSVCTLAAQLGSARIINGQPVGDKFKAVGTFNFSCTITKVGETHFITAAHCIRRPLASLWLKFQDFSSRVSVRSVHIHPSWIVDCSKFKCNGKEVGSPNMTPGRADVALIIVSEKTSDIPVIEILFSPLNLGTPVALVGAGCTRGVEPGGKSQMRYAMTSLQSPSTLKHEHSLYKDISEITGQANWITPGYAVSRENASLCPGDSGGPMLTQDESGAWRIIGIAADYTFDGPYRDGAETITNLHTRLDTESYHNVGEWIQILFN